MGADPLASSTLRIRAAGRSDVEAIATLERSTFEDDAYPSVFVHQAIELWPDLVCVAVDAGLVQGYALAAPSQRRGEAWILAVAVRASGRGRGVGGALTAELLGRLRRSAFSRVVLTVHPGNAAAVSLYRRVGFVIEEELEDYFGEGEPRLRLALSLRDEEKP